MKITIEYSDIWEAFSTISAWKCGHEEDEVERMHEYLANTDPDEVVDDLTSLLSYAFNNKT